MAALMVSAVSCVGERCLSPFSVGAGGAGVFSEGPIKAGKKFSMVFEISTSSVSVLEDIEIKVLIPPELDVDLISQPKDAPEVKLVENVAEWKSELKSTLWNRIIQSDTKRRFAVRFISKTDWEKWSHPIMAEVGLYQKGSGDCRNFPDGFYGKTIKWSHEKFDNPGWQIRP